VSERIRPTRAQTRAKLLAAALEVFGDRGIAASSVSEVAAAAGMTKGAVYSNFASKDELVLAIMEEHALARLTDALASLDTAENPESAAAGVGAVLIGAIRTDAVWHRLLAEYFALAHRDRDMQLALRARRREAREAVARALGELSRRADVALPMTPERLAVVLFALSNGLGVESGIDPEAVPDDLLGELLGLIGRDFFAGLSEAGSD
jgi:AcrR family transcriptional regulator